MQRSALLRSEEKRRIEQEFRYLHTKSDREANFEKKAKISIKVQRWFREEPFSDAKMQEAEAIQTYLNQLYSKAEQVGQQKFEAEKIEPVVTEEVKKPVYGLGHTVK